MAEIKSKTMTPEEIAAEAAEKEKKHQAELEAYYNERVDVYIHKPEGESDNSITVTHNGKNWQIKYGEIVKVPRYIALIIEESKKNKEYADEKADEYTKSKLIAEY